MEGRPPSLSLPVQKELLKRASKTTMGAGFTRSQFLDLASEIHVLHHGGGEPLCMADTTLKKEFARLLPGLHPSNPGSSLANSFFSVVSAIHNGSPPP